MTWVLSPLEGKYYGTKVENTKTGETASFWFGFRTYTEDEVSQREKDEGWNPFEQGYDHVEDRYSLEAAVTFVNAMNAKNPNASDEVL